MRACGWVLLVFSRGIEIPWKRLYLIQVIKHNELQKIFSNSNAKAPFRQSSDFGPHPSPYTNPIVPENLKENRPVKNGLSRGPGIKKIRMEERIKEANGGGADLFYFVLFRSRFIFR